MRHSTIIMSIVMVSLISITYAALTDPIVLDPLTGLQIQWELMNDTITFAVSANVASWLGIGWHTYNDNQPKAMVGVDFAVATFEPTVTVTDMVSTPGGGPPPIPDTSIKVNGTNDILSFSGYQTADYSFFIFTRKLVTGDVHGDNDIVVGPAGLDLVWAHGENNTFAFHGIGHAGRVKLDLVAHTAENDLEVFIGYHIGFMFFTFGVIMPFGIFIARFLRQSHAWWFPVHMITLFTGVVFSIIGLGMAIKHCGGLEMSSNHAIMGITTLVLFFVTVIMGSTSHLMYDPNRTKTPLFPDIIHHFGGRITQIFGFVTIILGMLLYGVPQGIIVVFGFLFAFYIIIFLFIEWYQWRFPHSQQVYHTVN
ncbi:hypothetical protein SAMD00019534_000760, partial [Acytostelium subglobosum LB1]|uniref:hypothetical protein n=1 Tax=Acytostelium subglobosum LB1 TaxID=1410327 RepID=UPI000644DB2E